MEERLTCLEEKLSSIQLSLEMLPDLLTRWDGRYSHDGGGVPTVGMMVTMLQMMVMLVTKVFARPAMGRRRREGKGWRPPASSSNIVTNIINILAIIIIITIAIIIICNRYNHHSEHYWHDHWKLS